MSIHFTLDGNALTAAEGTTILEAAQANGTDLPTLCHLPELKLEERCGICVVEQEPGDLVNSCATAVEEGAVYHTRSPAVMSRRREVTRLLLSRHEPSCQVCDRHGDCELERLLGVACEWAPLDQLLLEFLVDPEVRRTALASSFRAMNSLTSTS